MLPINKRKRAVPKSNKIEGSKVSVRFMGEQVLVVEGLKNLPHELRKQELSELHNIPIKDIFVDPVNGVELYRTPRNTWVSKPENRGE